MNANSQRTRFLFMEIYGQRRRSCFRSDGRIAGGLLQPFLSFLLKTLEFIL